MQFIDIAWLHKSEEDPIRLVSALDAQRHEVRKLEFFRNGTVGFATENHETLDTRLGTGALPTLAEINADPQFRGVEIEESEFELLWKTHVHTAA